MINLNPKYNLIAARDKIVVTEVGLGERVGGMSSTASSFSKGGGDEIFKVTSKGIHLGAAEFEDAPFSVDMAGNLTGTGLTVDHLDIPDITSANSFHVDTSGNSWWGATSIGSAPAKVLNTGASTFSDMTITGGTITGVSIAIGSGDNIFKADSNGIYLGNATFASAPFSVNMQGDVIASSITIDGYVATSQGAYGGDGSDGALTLTSGTTNIDCQNLPFLIKNYTSITITGSSANLTFTNPGTNGTLIVLKSQGDVIITSTAGGGSAINLGSNTALRTGATGGAGGTGGSSGAVGNKGLLILGTESSNGKAGVSGTPSQNGAAPGAALTLTGFYSLDEYVRLSRKSNMIACGSSGGGGGGGAANISGGDGGMGGGAMIIECAGALTFTGATIDARGAVGKNGTNAGSNNTYGGGAGGGGAGGMVLITYRSLAETVTGTINTNGGDGGTGGNYLGVAPAGNAGSGGSGAGSYGGLGGAGGDTATVGGAAAGVGGGGGGARGLDGVTTTGGAAGSSLTCLVAQNFDFS